MKRLKRSKSRLNRTLDIESLEQRQLLTVVVDVYPPEATRVRVAEDSFSQPFSPLRWRDAELVSFEQPSHGTVEFTPRDHLVNSIIGQRRPYLTYTPDADFTGIDSFEVTTIDADGKEYIDTIWLNVVVSNHAIRDWARVLPASRDNQIDVLQNDHVVVNTGDELLVNRLRIVSVTSGNGQATISEDGTSLIYDVSGDFVGYDRLTYTVEDSLGNQSEADVTVHVTQDADANHYLSEREFLNALLSGATKRYEHEFGRPTRQHRWYSDSCHVFWRESFTDTVSFSTTVANLDATNVQVEGVDEGDIVETDGDYLYVASDSTLSIVDVRNPNSPTLTSQVAFEETIVDMYLHEDRLTIISGATSTCNVFQHQEHESEFTLQVLDVESPDSPQRVSTTTIEGRYEDSRVIDDALHLISTRWIAGVAPESVNVGNAREEVLFDEGVEQFVSRFIESLDLPSMTAESGGNVTNTAMVTWDNVLLMHDDVPKMFTSISTFDLGAADGVAVDVDSYAGLVSEVYASQDAIYIFDGHPFSSPATETSVHKFEFVERGMGVDFAASGTFHGTLLSQFSADEHDGFLRVAASAGRDISNIYVMQQNGSQLEIAASLIDIAPGERIFASRFDGDRAFVTTFRQVDPFFVIDLSDPLNPQIDGELKIPGFSNYLQSVDENHVIGIGRSEALGGEVEVSLFNVADPENPKRLTTYGLGSNVSTPFSRSAFGDDHLEVTFVEEEGILAIPVRGYVVEGRTAHQLSSVLVLHVDTNLGTISKLGEVEVDDFVTRSVHINGHLFSVSPTTVYVTALANPNNIIASVELPDPPSNDELTTLEFDSQRATDLNGDGRTTGIDVGMINNALIREGMGETVEETSSFDVDNDGHLSGRDLLLVVNKVIRNAAANQDRLVDSEAIRAPLSTSVVEAGVLPTMQVEVRNTTSPQLAANAKRLTTSTEGFEGLVDLSIQDPAAITVPMTTGSVAARPLALQIALMPDRDSDPRWSQISDLVFAELAELR